MNPAIEPQLAAPSLPIAQRYDASPLILWIVPLLLIATAELLIALVNLPLGLALYALLLIGLTLRAGLSQDEQGRRLALALTLAPLLRILSLALPLASLPQPAWYPVISAPLLISALLVIRQLRMSRAELGLRLGNPLIQLMLIGGGLGVGAAEYALLGAPQLVVAFSWNALTLLAVLLLIFTGFVEELIFRGLLQAAALPALGRWSLVYVSLLFAVLHIGYFSVPVVAFMFGVGLIFACTIRLGGSIVGVALAHGLANITLFILMPSLAQQAASPTAVAIRSGIAVGSVLAISALAFLLGHVIWQGRALRAPTLPMLCTTSTDARMPGAAVIRPSAPRSGISPAQLESNQKLFFTALRSSPASRRSTVDRVPGVPMIRTLRRAAGITYVELGQRTQLPARLLAEIEHGLRLPTHAQLSMIFQALGVDIQQVDAAA